MSQLVDLVRKIGIGAAIAAVAVPVAAYQDGDPDRPIILGAVPNLLVVGPGERVQLVFSVDCRVPQVPVDGYVTPMEERSVTLELSATSTTSDGTNSMHYQESIVLVSGSEPTFYEPEPEPGDTTRAITISAFHVEYRGNCDVHVGGRIAGSDGQSHTTIGGASDSIYDFIGFNPQG